MSVYKRLTETVCVLIAPEKNQMCVFCCDYMCVSLHVVLVCVWGAHAGNGVCVLGDLVCFFGVVREMGVGSHSCVCV